MSLHYGKKGHEHNSFHMGIRRNIPLDLTLPFGETGITFPYSFMEEIALPSVLWFIILENIKLEVFYLMTVGGFSNARYTSNTWHT